MKHPIESTEEKERAAMKNFRLAAHYLEIKQYNQALHHAELRCEDMKLIKLEKVEAASAVSGIGEEK